MGVCRGQWSKRVVSSLCVCVHHGCTYSRALYFIDRATVSQCTGLQVNEKSIESRTYGMYFLTINCTIKGTSKLCISGLSQH